MQIKLTQHPLWLVGFRPLFSLALVAGMLLPVLWILLLAGRLTLPSGPLSPLQWHAHEMFYGFGWALLGGFLLTASKNWVAVRGHHGLPLLLLTVAWLLERGVMACANQLPAPLFWLGVNLYLPGVIALVMYTLIRHRAQDSFADNYFFLLSLPFFLIADNLLLSAAYFNLGWSLTLGLFRLVFLVMLERTLIPFMKGALQLTLPRHAWLDGAIKVLALGLIPAALLPAWLAASLALALALLLGLRFLLWKPLQALTRIDTGIMYLGYLALLAQLLLEASALLIQPAWVGSLSLHVFSFGVMGLIIPAMVMRISRGHTGRKVRFDGWDNGVLGIMMLALLVRTLLPQLWPAAYAACLHVAATCWLAAFAILAWRYIPMYWRPRLDGKAH